MSRICIDLTGDDESDEFKKIFGSESEEIIPTKKRKVDDNTVNIPQCTKRTRYRLRNIPRVDYRLFEYSSDSDNNTTPSSLSDSQSDDESNDDSDGDDSEEDPEENTTRDDSYGLEKVSETSAKYQQRQRYYANINIPQADAIFVVLDGPRFTNATDIQTIRDKQLLENPNRIFPKIISCNGEARKPLILRNNIETHTDDLINHIYTLEENSLSGIWLDGMSSARITPSASLSQRDKCNKTNRLLITSLCNEILKSGAFIMLNYYHGRDEVNKIDIHGVIKSVNQIIEYNGYKCNTPKNITVDDAEAFFRRDVTPTHYNIINEFPGIAYYRYITNKTPFIHIETIVTK